MSNIPSDELVTAAKDLSSKAYVMLMYYYSKHGHWTWHDQVMADELGFSIRQVKEYRRELINKDYLLVLKGSVSNVFIGREAVMKFKNIKEEN